MRSRWWYERSSKASGPGITISAVIQQQMLGLLGRGHQNQLFRFDRLGGRVR